MWQPLCRIVTVLGKAFWRCCARGLLHAWPVVANVPQVTKHGSLQTPGQTKACSDSSRRRNKGAVIMWW